MGLSDCRVEALLAVSDLERARRFYERQLGLVPGEEEEEAVHYPCAHGSVSTSRQRTPASRRRRSPAGSSMTSTRP
jgi:catechol 2,3-dioxygenase-like lactoylglutathione lyase family enzyme